MTEIIEGRPDLGGIVKKFGITRAKRFPRYVYSNRGMLIHILRSVEFHWWKGEWDRMVGVHHAPPMHGDAYCGQTFFFSRGRSMTSNVLVEGKELCVRCLGNQPLGAAKEKWEGGEC